MIRLPRGLRFELLIPVAVGVGVGALYLRQPGRTLGTGVSDLLGWLTGDLPLDDEQREMVQIIEDRFRRAGLGWLGPAAVANAYAESRLEPKAAGDGDKSIGLFQLHENGGGRGLTREQREDPITNTDRIISEARSQPTLMGMRGLATNAELASEFARYVERCAECGVNPGDSTAQLTYRAELVSRLFGAELAATVP